MEVARLPSKGFRLSLWKILVESEKHDDEIRRLRRSVIEKAREIERQNLRIRLLERELETLRTKRAAHPEE